jgi:hypothetical protein
MWVTREKELVFKIQGALYVNGESAHHLKTLAVIAGFNARYKDDDDDDADSFLERTVFD